MTAAIATYDDLVEKVADVMVVTSADTNIPAFIRLAEAQFERELRVREMEKQVEYNIGGQETLLPTDFLEARAFTLPESGCIVEHVSIESLDGRASKTGAPHCFTIYGQELIFYPVPTSEGTVKGKMRYIARFEPLSPAYPVNPVLTNHPDIYLYGALTHAAEYIKDREAQAVYAGLYRQAVSMANDSNKKMIGSRRRIRPNMRMP